MVEPNLLPDTAAVVGELNIAGFSNGKTGAASMLLEGYFDKIKYLSWRIQGSLKKGGNLKTPQAGLYHEEWWLSSFVVRLLDSLFPPISKRLRVFLSPLR